MIHLLDDDENAEEHSIPWMPEEYIKVDGQELVYTVAKDGAVTVRFPGGASASVDMLEAQGRQVVMPRILRVNDYA